MNRKGIIKKHSFLSRALAVVLAFAMMFTSSGFQVLAEEAGTESQSEVLAAQQAAESEAARIAAEEAAARQTAESEAARIAAEEEAARQAAESEAARIAAEEEETARLAAESEAARVAAEEEAARQAASEAASQQAASDAETARKQQEEATQNTPEETAVSETGATEADSEEADPVTAGKLVLKVASASTQNEREPAKITVEYGLGSECTLASVDARLYIWNDTVQLPQFGGGSVYTDSNSGRQFTLKTDSDGDMYIGYSLKPGESFKQQFLFIDSSVTAGTSVTFDVAICAIGEIPIDNSIQSTPGKVTYALPAEETEETETDSETETSGETEAEADTEEASETETEMETETEADSEEMTEKITEAGTEEASEEITEEATEEETETETEPEYGTEFTYEDSAVVVTAQASLAAKLPKDAVLKADLIPEGSAAYEEAVALVESQMGAPSENQVAEYIFYDVYFLVDGERVEPDEGLVVVNMNFKTPVLEGSSEGAVEDASVVHIKDGSEVENLGNDIALNENGGVEEMGFTTDSFSPFGVQVLKEAAQRAATSSDLSLFLYDAEVVPDDGRGQDGAPTKDNGSCRVKIYFKETSALQFDKTLTYTLPDGITVYRTEMGTIVGRDTLAGDNLGTYTITPSHTDALLGTTTPATLTVTFNDTILGESFDSYGNLDCDIEFSSWFNINAGEEGVWKEISFNGDTKVSIYFEAGNRFSGKKSASSYVRGTNGEPGYFEFTVEAQSDEAISAGSAITIEDTLGTNLELVSGSVAITGITATVATTTVEKDDKSGFTVTINDAIPALTPVVITYRATIKDVTLLDENGNVTNVGNTAIIEKGKTDEVILTASPTYQPGGVATKSNDGVSSADGKVQWTITINPNGDHDMSNVEISDALQSEGITYDTSTPISCSPALPEFTWNKILSTDERSWSYTLPDNADYNTYVITYKTVVPDSDTEQSYSNIISIGSQRVDSSTVTVPGDGDGTGIKKVYDKEEIINGKKYVWWNSIITISKDGAEDVVYSDKLVGPHKLEDPFTATIKDASGTDVSAEDYELKRVDDKNFIVTFKNNFPATSQDTVYIISYRTEVTENGTVNNIGYLRADGKTTASPVKYLVQDYSFSKSGSITDKENGIITWTVVLNDGTFDLDVRSITVVDTFSSNLTYVKNSAKVTRNGNVYKQESDSNKMVTTNGNTITIQVGQIPGEARYLLQYQTKLSTTVPIGSSATFSNSASIQDENGKVLGVPTSSVVFSNKVLSKEIIDKADSDNQFVASYQVLLNEERTFYHEDVSEFNIVDTLSNNQVLNRDSVKLERQLTAGGVWTEVPLSEYSDSLLLQDHVINMTVKTSAANINRVAYRLTYKATVGKGNSTGNDVEYSNDIKYTINGKTYEEGSEDTADFSQSSSGGGSGSVIWYKVIKQELKSGEKNLLADAEFDLYKVDASGNITDTVVTGMKTGTDGVLTFGKGKNVTVDENICDLVVNQRYMLRETNAPAGYLPAADTYFYVTGTTVETGENAVVAPGYVFYIDDTRAVTVKAKKTWEVLIGTVIPAVKFTLVRRYKGESSWTAVAGAEEKTINGTITEVEWTELPFNEMVNNALKEIEYSVQETFVDSNESSKYSQKIESTSWDDANSIYTIAVKNATTTHKVEKTWEDNNNGNLNRPNKITVQLKRNNTNYEATVEIVPDSDGNWKYEWTGLPKYDSNNNLYIYTVEETKVEHYSPVYDNTDSTVTKITNREVDETVDHKVNKVWNDGENADGKRPSEIQVQLYNGTTPYGSAVTVKALANGDWIYTWKNLPKYINNKLADYNAKEVTTPTGYETPIEKTENGVTTITNTRNYEKVDKTVKKVWTGTSEEEDNNRPASIQVKLIAKAMVNSVEQEISLGQQIVTTITLPYNNTWEYTWKNLPKNYLGSEITYSVKEITDLTGIGYTTAYNTDNGTLVITNTYNRELTNGCVKYFV